MAITTLNNLAINRSDTAAADQLWTATSATATDFQAAAAGGSMVLIKTQTITSSTATMEFLDGVSSVTFDNTYRRYLCIFDDYRPVTDATVLSVHFYQSGAFLTSGYQTSAAHIHGNTSGMYTGTGYASALDATGSAADESAYGEIHFINPSDTGTKPSCYSRFCTMNSSSNETNQHISSGGHNTAGAITGFKFLSSSGNIANLQASLYGITTS